jgi:hypothetical protein
MGIRQQADQKTSSQRGTGLFQRAKGFAVEFLFDVEAMLAGGFDVSVTRRQQMSVKTQGLDNHPIGTVRRSVARALGR